MADSTATIRATFETREAAGCAVEHLVQHNGISSRNAKPGWGGKGDRKR